VEAGADKENASINEDTPLLSACADGHIEIVRLLVQDGADKGQKMAAGFTPLNVACQNGHMEIAQLLLEAGADKNQAATDGSTALLVACQHGHIEVVRLLVEAGADKEKAATSGFTPLYAASQNGHVEVVRLLMEAGADKEKAATSGFTPLYAACEKGHVEVAQLLVEAGADKEKAATDGATPLLIACQTGHVEVVRLLVEAGADKDKATTNGYTPLHIAARHGHDAICMLLTFKGADLTARTSGNRTPADAAQAKGGTSLAEHLRSSNGVHCLRCTGPSLERRLLWNDTNQQQQTIMLDEMQAQWLARVVEGCTHARVGLTLRGAFSRGLSTSMLLHVMGYVFDETQAHLQSCISMGRMAAAVGAVPENQKQGLPPRLGLVSYAQALQVTSIIAYEGTVLEKAAAKRLHAGIAQLMAASDDTTEEGGCTWLYDYCKFLQQRHLGEALCARCGAPGATGMRRCSKCKSVRYCSRECQQSDWKQHKLQCKKVSKKLAARGDPEAGSGLR
jgi:ankyrin repeat protein